MARRDLLLQPKSRLTKAITTHARAPFSAGLLGLPNEVLIEIGTHLSIPDLRRLGRANRKLYLFAGDYLIRYRCNARLVTLPNELILHIVQLMGSQKDRSHLARASQRFYPLVMGYIARHNVRHNGSSLLNYAAGRNLTRMAQNILRLGGDVNTQRGFRLGFMRKFPNPLLVSAYCGHERMVQILLEAGASQFIDGVRIPLGAAIFRRHEKVAMILSQGVKPSEFPLKKSLGSALQLACEAKLVNLVRVYLEYEKKKHVARETFFDRCISLRQLLKADAGKDMFFKREVHEDVYQIAMLLLEHGADPDIHISTTSKTARAIAAQHPDPRVGLMFSQARLSPVKSKSALKIGRQWMKASGDTATTFHNLHSIPPTLEEGRYAKLWDFLAEPETEIRVLGFEDADVYEESHLESHVLDSSDFARLLPPPFSAFPQLGTPTVGAHDGCRDFWAEAQDQVPAPSVCSSQTIAGHAEIAGSQAVKEDVKQSPEIEQFPQLGGLPVPTHNAGKDLWAGFAKNKGGQSASNTQKKAISGSKEITVQKTDKSSAEKKKK